MKKKETYADFGNKIGGAKKDLWVKRGLLKSDIEEMNLEEKKKYVTKHAIWLKPDYEKLIEEGRSRYAVYFIKKVRDALPVVPIVSPYINISLFDGIYQEYIDAVSELRDMIMEHCREDRDILTFWDVFSDENNGFMVNGKIQSRYMLKNKTLSLLRPSLYGVAELKKEADDHAFGIKKEEQSYFKAFSKLEVHLYDENKVTVRSEDKRLCVQIKTDYAKYSYFFYRGDMAQKEQWEINTFFIVSREDHTILINNIPDKQQAETMKEQIARKKAIELDETLEQKLKSKARKKKFAPPQLGNIIRTGNDYRKNYNILGQDMLDNFGFYGGEFGNWLNENDRRWSMNMAFDAFVDLAKALNISIKDVSLAHGLSIAFGARGSGNAAAHYEPLRKVINLTKMKGAGSLGHEWGHALDHFLQITMNHRENGYATESLYLSGTPIIKEIVYAMKHKKNDRGMEVYTDFYKDSMKFDGIFTKQDKGYWKSEVEMFARAFACYVKDRCENQNDYLSGHADLAVNIIDGKVIKAYPLGEEREALNNLFDKLFHDLREKSIFSPFNPEEVQIQATVFEATEDSFYEEDKNFYYQMSMFDM